MFPVSLNIGNGLACCCPPVLFWSFQYDVLQIEYKDISSHGPRNSGTLTFLSIALGAYRVAASKH